MLRDCLPEEFKSDLSPFSPDFEHVLFDLSRAPLERMRARAELKLALSLMQAVIAGELERWLIAEGGRLAAILTAGHNAEFFRRLMYYAFGVGDLNRIH